MRRRYEHGNSKEFDLKLIKGFMSIKRLEAAENLFKLFTFHSGHCSAAVPTRKWTTHILMHLNTINSFPGHPERKELRMTSSEMKRVIENIFE